MATLRDMVNRLKELRLAANYSQDKLAELVGTTGQQVSRLERTERKLSPDWMERFSKALDVPVTAFIDDRPLEAIRAKSAPDVPDEIDEIELLGLWREMQFPSKVALMKVAKIIAELARNSLDESKRKQA